VEDALGEKRKRGLTQLILRATPCLARESDQDDARPPRYASSIEIALPHGKGVQRL